MKNVPTNPFLFLLFCISNLRMIMKFVNASEVLTLTKSEYDSVQEVTTSSKTTIAYRTFLLKENASLKRILSEIQLKCGSPLFFSGEIESIQKQKADVFRKQEALLLSSNIAGETIVTWSQPWFDSSDGIQTSDHKLSLNRMVEKGRVIFVRM